MVMDIIHNDPHLGDGDEDGWRAATPRPRQQGLQLAQQEQMLAGYPEYRVLGREEIDHLNIYTI